MPATDLIQTRIDPDVKSKASTILAGLGLTVSDAVRILLTRTANEGALPFTIDATSEAYDSWFRAKVLDALSDPTPSVSNDVVKERFSARRNAAEGKIQTLGRRSNGPCRR